MGRVPFVVLEVVVVLVMLAIAAAACYPIRRW